jgi:outer membrane protein assembly factor BamB
MAFKVVSDSKTRNPVLEPGWISEDFDLPDPVVIANGVIFGLSNGENADQRGAESRRLFNTHPAVLRALDSKTGKELFNSGSSMTSWVHFSGLAIADGRVFTVDHDSNVYCFGLGTSTKSNSLPRLNLSKLAKAINAENGHDELSTSWIGRAGRQDEILRSWIRRAGLALILAFLAGVGGLWAGVKDGRARSRLSQ